MAILRRDIRLDTAAAGDDLMPMVRAVEAALLDATSTIPHFQLDGYDFSSSGGDFHNLSREELADELASAAKPIKWVSTMCTNRLAPHPRDFYMANIMVFAPTREGEHPLITVNLEGPGTDATSGLFTRIENRITNEVERQDRAGWTAEPIQPRVIPEQVVASAQASPPAPSTPPAPPTPPAQPTPSVPAPIGFWRRFGRTISENTLAATVIGGIIAGGVILIITLIVTGRNGNNSAPNSTPVPTTTSTTLSTPTSAPRSAQPPGTAATNNGPVPQIGPIPATVATTTPVCHPECYVIPLEPPTTSR